MKNAFTILLLITAFALNAQTTDYNINKKGFVAEGYDVISYFSNTAKKGNDKYIATYEGVKYKFSSQKNLDIFNNSPQKFVPKYGGYCAYAVAVKGKKVSINPEAFEIRDQRLYLFYNSWGNNTLKSWLNESANDLKMAADKNWLSIKNKR